MSFAQERLWFLEQLDPGTAVYNICRALRLSGRLSLSALEASLNEIVRRHEILRSAIRIAEGGPVQTVKAPFEVKISLTDLQQKSDRDREQEISSRIQQAADAPFRFSAGRFLRAALLRVANDEHILVLTTHHIVSDAWSMGIVTRELWSLYEAHATGNSPPLTELPVQYADFAVWQREWLQGEVLKAQVSYWKKQLKDLANLNLPSDRPRPVRQSFHGARTPITLPELLTLAINELSNQSGVTPFMTLLAAFQVLLYRYSGREDIVIGSPIANRARTELEPLIGFLINALVLRSDLSGNPGFRELLARVREVCLDAYTHQDLPFEKLVQELQPERDQSRNPLFQVMFVLQNATRPFSGIAGLRIEPIEFEMTRSPFDLSLFLREREGRYIGYVEYNTDLFNRDTSERMAGHYQTLLEAIVANPNQSIATLPILTDAERHQILLEWNDTASDYPKDKCIHQLFEEQVERTPDAIALEFEGKGITYRELNRRANQLAHHLISLGIGPERLVGICVERSIEMVVGLLGILKAGGAYMPLDPAYPKERRAFMLENAQASIVLTTDNLIESREWRLSDGDPRSSILKIVFLDADAAVFEQQSTDNPNSRTGSETLAYVIYTSGSTGQPKGVAIEHRNACNLLYWAKSVYAPEQLSGVLASTSICFDLSVFELFAPLSWGGKIILVENVLSMREAVDKQITLINTVPSAMAALLSTGLPNSIAIVNLAGEPLLSKLVDQLYQIKTVEKVYDLYGPSETTTYSTFARRAANGPATIGRPIANTKIYLLDSNLQPVPIGVPGEIYIGGAGVARGYLNRPDLTNEKFITRPFSDLPSERLYRTGDLARYLPDGNIEFLGRADNQVKIHGYRIELGEIEAILNRHPAVKDSVLVVRARDSSEEKDLIGYVVPKVPSALSVTELRRFLGTKLPEYMVPSDFLMLEGLPLTPNGKIDRSKLPSPKESPRDLNRVPIPPRPGLEELVANIWREVLQTEVVSVDDNFFALGGHSLLAIQIVSRLQAALHKQIPLRLLFDRPTVAGLAMTLARSVNRRSVELPPITNALRNRALPLSMNQEHLWHVAKMIPGTHFFNMPYTYQLKGDLKSEALERALLELMRRHQALRTVFAEVTGSPVQIIRDTANVPLSYIDLHEGSADEIFHKAADWILKERTGPFDLQSGPLMRFTLLRLMDSNYLLLVVIHHIISDHWSMQIFRDELNVLYSAFSQGQSSPLSEPTIQFADYAFWERELVTKGVLNTQREFWERKLLHSRGLSRSVHKDIGKKSAAFVRQHQFIDVDAPLFKEVKSFAARRSVTPFIVMLSTVYALMHSYTGQRDLRIGVLVANRRWRGAESVIGHFVNTVVLPIHLSRGMTFEDLLEVTREGVVTIQENQEFPFEALARTLERRSDLKREALFQVLVAYNVTSPTVYLPGPSFAPLHLRDARLADNITVTGVDLIFSFLESSTKLTGTVNYRKGLLRRSPEDSVNDYLGSLVETILFRTSAPLSAASFGPRSTKPYFS